MNKILRLTFAAALALVSTLSFAQTTVTFTAGTDKASANGAATLTKDGISIAIGKDGGDFSRTDNYRLYQNQDLTISSTAGNITKIAFTCSIDKKDKTKGGANNLTTETGTYTPSSDNLTGVWEGTSSSVVFKATPKQFRATKIEVTYAASGNFLAAPTISGNTSFTESATVTITAADGATIYYTTNGQEPDDREGTQYTAPFTISETTTVKAIAYKGDLESSIATQEFTKKEAQKLTGEGTLANPYTCADVIALENGQQAPSDSVYVKGKVSQAATSLNTTYGDINFYLSDDGTTTSQIEAYNSYYYKRAKYTSESQMPKLGDEVVLYGKITSFNNTIELARGNYLVSLKSSGVKVDTLSFTASEALAALTAGTQPTGVCYITGIVSKVDTTGIGQYGSITYYISDDGTTTNQLEVYHGKSFNGEKFTKDFFLKEGDKVKILGQLINYTKDGNVTPEVTSYSKLIELNGKTTGITEIKADKAVLDANAPMYNLAGQRVDKSFKGIVIQKGHKFLNK